MPIGPGKYDDLCTMVRQRSKAHAAVILVMGGNKGSGFSVQADVSSASALPELLEYMAKEIRKSRSGNGIFR